MIFRARDLPFAVGAALGGVGEESLPLDLLGFFNSGVTRSNTISNSATEAQEVSKNCDQTDSLVSS